MHILLRLLLTFALAAVIVHSQGGRGGGGGGGGGGSRGGGGYRGGTRSGGSCQGSGCRTAGIIAGSVIGGVFAIIAAALLTIFCCRRYRARRAESNSDFVSKTALNERQKSYQTYEEDYLKNGNWLGRYYQYGRWHGPSRMSLEFNRTTNRVSGNGYDDVGKFIIDGTFSLENQRIAMGKTYELGTGNPKENFGHTVNLQMTWNSSSGQFEGKWTVNTSRYHGEEKYELKFEDISKPYLEKRAD